MQLLDHEARADTAYNFLAETDEEHARLKSKMHLLESLRKRVISLGFEGSTKTAQEAKRQDAYNTAEYLAHIQQQEQIEFEFFHLNNRRDRAQQAIDFYRTMSANQRNT